MDDKQTQNTPTTGQVQTQAPAPQPQIGLVRKEQEPIVQVDSGQRITEVEKASLEKGPEVTPELSEIGVREVFDRPDLNLEDKKAGIQLANESVPVKTAPTGAVKLPMTEEEAIKILKVHKRVADSVVWLAAEIVKQFKKMHGRIIKGS